MDRPNGLAFSLDERLLYVSDTGAPKNMRVFDVADDGSAHQRPASSRSAPSAASTGSGSTTDGRIWTSAGDGVHCYDPDGTLIGKVLVPESVANVAWGWPKRNRLYICATTSLYAVLLAGERSEDDVAMIDLHIHFPMRLLGGVEAPRDVVKGMTRVRGREEGKLRAAVLAIAARLFNFRHWDATWRVTPELLEQGEVSVACSVLYRPFSELDLDEPYGAPPESAYYPKLVELMDATEAEIERTGGVVVRTRRGPRPRPACATCTASRAASTSARRPTEVTAHVARAGRARRALHHARPPVLAPRRRQHARAALSARRGLQRALPAGEGRRAVAARRGGGARDVRAPSVLVDISHMRDDAIDETFALIEALDRETGRDPRDYPVIVSHAGYRFGGQKYNVSDGTIARIAARGGVIGLIFAQHQINDGLRRTDTKTLAESLDVLGRHIDAIGPEHVALGSDLDGFIKPTLGGIDTAADLAPFAAALRARYPDVADDDPRGQRAARHPAALCQCSILTPRISIRISPRACTSRSSTASHSGQRRTVPMPVS